MPTITALPSGVSATSAIQHPVYIRYLPIWQKFRDVFEGTGGFQDGSYLVAHPREWKDFTQENPSNPTKKLKARRTLARYENVAATILDQKRTALFREPITRMVGGAKKGEAEKPHPLEDFWDNVDGTYCSIDWWMAEAFVASALFGHVFHYMDRPSTPSALTAADQQSPFLRLYTPMDVPDWLTDDRGWLTAVRLLEAQPRTDLDQQAAELRPRERVVTDEYWELVEFNKARQVESRTKGLHKFGILPVVVQYAKRRSLTPVIGQSVLGDPKLYIDLYNLTSEIRELLRDQTFGILNVQLGTGPDKVSALEAQAMMGDEKGSDNVMFTPGPASYVQPDTHNVTVYQEERKELLRTIYRLSAIPFESDSKDAEAQGSLKLKREDMNQVLSGYAKECEQAEYKIAELWFRSQYGETDWEKQYEDAEVVIRYPQTFDVTPFAELLEQAQAASTLEYGPKFMEELRKRLIPKFLPDLPSSTQDELEKELASMPVKSPLQQKQEEMQLRYGQPGGGFPPQGQGA